MEEKPLVSVVIPAFNSARFLRECMESIVNQTYQNLEILIIDDTPDDDGTASILESYDDSRISHIKPTVRMGLVKSLNYGISVSKGKYIARMDADDISHLERIERQVHYLNLHPEVGVLGCSCYKINEKNKIIGVIEHPSINDEIKIKMLFNAAFVHPAVMIRKDILSNSYDEHIIFSEDYELWTRLMKITEFHNLKQKLLKYRILDNSAMHSQLSRIQNDEFYKKYKNVLSVAYDNVLNWFDIDGSSVFGDNYIDLFLAKRLSDFSIEERAIFLLKCKTVVQSKYHNNAYLDSALGYQWLKMAGKQMLNTTHFRLSYHGFLQGIIYISSGLHARIEGILAENKNVYNWKID